VRVVAAMHALCALQLVAAGLAVALHLSLLVLCGLVALGAVLSALVRPVSSALVPQLVDGPEELAGANAVGSTMEAGAMLVGPAVAGALLAVVAPPFAFVAIALLSVAGAVVTFGIRPATSVRAAAPTRGGGGLGHLLAVFEPLLGDGRVRAIVGLAMAQAVIRGLLNVFVVAAAVSLLGLGEAGAGGLLSLLGLGGLLGPGLSFGLAAGRRLALPFAGGVAAWGGAVLAIAAWPTPSVAWSALAGLGLGNAVEDVAGFTLLHRLIPEHRLGRAFGVLWGVASASVAAGSLGAPALIAVCRPRGDGRQRCRLGPAGFGALGPGAPGRRRFGWSLGQCPNGARRVVARAATVYEPRAAHLNRHAVQLEGVGDRPVRVTSPALAPMPHRRPPHRGRHECAISRSFSAA
jgi:hypothetical protein